MLDVQGNLYTGDSVSLSAFNKPFWAQITSYDGSQYYAWTEVEPLPGGTFQNRDGGRTGTLTSNPAFEPNAGTVTLNSYVQLIRAYFDTARDWVYVIRMNGTGVAGALTVKNTDAGAGDTNSTLSTSVTTFDINQGSGLRGTLVTAGEVKIAAQDASFTHAGVINLTTQTLGAGNKVFQDNTVTHYGSTPAGTYAAIVIDNTVVGDADPGILIQSGIADSQIRSNDWTMIYRPAAATETNFEINPVDPYFGSSFPCPSLLGWGTNTSVISTDINAAILTALGLVVGSIQSDQATFNNATLAVVDNTGTVQTGIYTTINYLKSPSGSGTLTFAGGLLVGST
jgi:hypothetical protein